MDFRRARPRHSVPGIEWRHGIHDARGAERNLDRKLHAKSGLRLPLSGRARLVRRHPLPAHLKRRTKRAKSGNKHDPGAIGIRQVLREEIVFSIETRLAAPLRPSEPTLDETGLPIHVEVPPAARSKGPEESPHHVGM